VFQNKELAESLLVLLHNKLAMLLVLWHNKDINAAGWRNGCRRDRGSCIENYRVYFCQDHSGGEELMSELLYGLILTGGAFSAVLLGAFWWDRRHGALPHRR
jgi:hypothetical protein